jgi:Holliday junction resolvase RusA-like endonuclease
MGLTLSQWTAICEDLGRSEMISKHPAHSARSQFRSGEPGAYRITIPGWHPATVNELMKSVKARIRLKKRDRGMVAIAALAQQIPAAHGRRRVHLAITMGPGQRGADPDAYWKSLLDAMVMCGLLIDDRKEYVVLDPVEFVRGKEPETTIELYDL